MGYSKIERDTDHDEKVRSWTRDQREMWKYLLANPHMGAHGSRIGCYVLDPMYAAGDLACCDWEPSRAHVIKQLEALHNEGRIVWDPSTRLVLLRRFFKHNPPVNPNATKACAEDVAVLPFSKIVMEALLEAVELYVPETFRKGEVCRAPISAAIRSRLDKHNKNADLNGSGTVKEPLDLGYPNQEQGQVQGVRDNAGSSNPGPGPDVENSSRDASPSLNGILAPLIRTHLWNSTTNSDKPPAGIDKTWTMARELSLAKELIARCRASPEQFAEVITHVRMALGYEADVPLTLKIFNAKDQGDALEEVLGYVRKQHERRVSEKGLTHIDGLFDARRAS